MERESSKVVLHFCGLLAQKPTQFEITILPTSSDRTDSDGALPLEESLVLVEGTYLGLDAKSLPYMTKEIRQDYKQRKERCHASGHTDVLLSTLSCLLLVNPDHATAWADRRRCLLQSFRITQDHKLWNEELQYINLLMTQHSKAPFSWAHRKYILRQVLDSRTTPWLDMFRGEARICREIAERYPKNYYAWTHRRYFLGIVMQATDLDVEEKTNILREEWDEMIERWLPMHVSDHSAAHYAAQVLDLWMHQLTTSKKAWKESESVMTKVSSVVKALLQSEESHETLWILRRMVFTIFAKLDDDVPNPAIWEECIVHSIAKELSKTESGKLGTGMADNVHALTFLYWVATSTDTTSRLSETAVQNVLSFLASHPDIHHLMWAKGREINR